MIQPRDNVLLRVERKDKNEKRHKLAQIVKIRFRVLRVDKAAKTVVIKRPDWSVENVSRSRVAIASKSDSVGGNKKETPPLPITSIIRNYSGAEKTTLNNSPATHRQPTTTKGRTRPIISIEILSRRTKKRRFQTTLLLNTQRSHG